MLPEHMMAGLVPPGSPVNESLLLMESLAFNRWFGPSAVNLSAGPAADAARMDLPIQPIGSTAVISVVGMTNKRVRWPGVLASYIATSAAIKAAVNDPKIDDILLKIDSPGGFVSGVADVADDIYAAAQQKPVTAAIDGLGASAAYWMASQANRIYAGRMDEVGSIGVLAVLYDVSEMAKKEGVKVEVFSTGKYKWTGVAGTSLTEDQRKYIQGLIDATGDAFVADVARGRRLPEDRVRAAADGRVFRATDALSMGLIDGIKSFAEVYDSIVASRARTKRLAGARAETASTGIS